MASEWCHYNGGNANEKQTLVTLTITPSHTAGRRWESDTASMLSFQQEKWVVSAQQ